MQFCPFNKINLHLLSTKPLDIFFLMCLNGAILFLMLHFIFIGAIQIANHDIFLPYFGQEILGLPEITDYEFPQLHKSRLTQPKPM